MNNWIGAVRSEWMKNMFDGSAWMNDVKIDYASVSELYSTSSMNEWGIGMMIQQWMTKGGVFLSLSKKKSWCLSMNEDFRMKEYLNGLMLPYEYGMMFQF